MNRHLRYTTVALLTRRPANSVPLPFDYESWFCNTEQVPTLYGIVAPALAASTQEQCYQTPFVMRKRDRVEGDLRSVGNHPPDQGNFYVATSTLAQGL